MGLGDTRNISIGSAEGISEKSACSYVTFDLLFVLIENCKSEKPGCQQAETVEPREGLRGEAASVIRPSHTISKSEQAFTNEAFHQL